jgi:F-type H+-transporting ATPase subunit delta
MARVTSGKRYAQAAFKLALEKGELDSWQVSLRKIADITTDEKLVALLENPKLPFEAKKAFLAELLGKINPLALNLAYLLVHKDKLGIAGDISHQYDRLLDTYHGIEHIEVITALPLDDEDKERISSRFKAITGHKTPSMFLRYNSVDESDGRAAAQRLADYLGGVSESSDTKVTHDHNSGTI